MSFRHTKKPKPCDICLSPYRTKIETMLKQGFSQRKTAEKYQKYFTCNPDTLRSKISRHKTKHKGLYKDIAYMPNSSKMSSTSLETFAQGLLEIGMKAIEHYPEKVKTSNIISAQRLLLEKQKTQHTEDALKIAMARFFGGFHLEDG